MYAVLSTLGEIQRGVRFPEKPTYREMSRILINEFFRENVNVLKSYIFHGFEKRFDKTLKKCLRIIIMKIIYLLLSLVNCEKIIRNLNIPACKNCIFYQPSQYNTFSSNLNKCVKFGDKDITTDEISYDFVEFCRKDETKCGFEGKFFKKEQNINMKIAKHKILRATPYLLLFFFIFITYLPTAILLRIFNRF
jgi:hypothetical protein